MSNTIRARIDSELTRRVGTWFTVRQIQDKLRVNPSTLKPLIMKYARENLLRRRSIKGTARSVEFSPAAPSRTSFESLLTRSMPYRTFGSSRSAGSSKSRSSSSRTSRSASSSRRSSSRKRR